MAAWPHWGAGRPWCWPAPVSPAWPQTRCKGGRGDSHLPPCCRHLAVVLCIPQPLFLQGAETKKAAHGGAVVAVPVLRSAPRGRPHSGIEPRKTSSITAAELQCQLMFRYQGFINYSMGFLVSSFNVRVVKGRKSQQPKQKKSSQKQIIRHQITDKWIPSVKSGLPDCFSYQCSWFSVHNRINKKEIIWLNMKAQNWVNVKL